MRCNDDDWKGCPIAGQPFLCLCMSERESDHVFSGAHLRYADGLVERNEGGDNGDDECKRQKPSEYFLERKQCGLLPESGVKVAGGELQGFADTVSLSGVSCEGRAEAGGCFRVDECYVFRQLYDIFLLEPVEHVAVEGGCKHGGHHRAAENEKEGIRQQIFRVEVLDGKEGEGDDEREHAESAEEDGEIEHLVGAVGRHGEIEQSEEDNKAAHTAGHEVAEAPALPFEPPVADEGAEQIAGKEIDVERIGARVVDVDDGCHVAGEKGGRGAEEHDQHHIEIAYDGSDLKQRLQADVGRGGMELVVDE